MAPLAVVRPMRAVDGANHRSNVNPACATRISQSDWSGWPALLTVFVWTVTGRGLDYTKAAGQPQAQSFFVSGLFEVLGPDDFRL